MSNGDAQRVRSLVENVTRFTLRAPLRLLA
jgi:hypothetical protein